MPHDYKRVLRERASRRADAGREELGGLMGKLGGFLQIERHGIPQRDPRERAHDYQEFLLTRPVAELREQGGALHGLRRAVLPQRLPARQPDPRLERPRLPRTASRTRSRELHATNNFPEFTGRLCPAPCEAACVLEIREGDAVTIKQIEHAIIDRAWEEGWVTPQPPRRETGQGVAVVGSGPAGMAAAQQLRRAGHRVTLFERDEAAGGLVRFGVPDFKIEKTVVQRRVEQLVAEGVELRCGVEVGRDVTVEELQGELRRGRAGDRLARAARPAGARAASSTGCTSRWTTSTSATAGSRASSAREPTVEQPSLRIAARRSRRRARTWS